MFVANVESVVKVTTLFVGNADGNLNSALPASPLHVSISKFPRDDGRLTTEMNVAYAKNCATVSRC